MSRTFKIAMLLALVGLLAGVPASAKIFLNAPDGRKVELKGGTRQPDLSMYRSPLESKVVDRRFYTNDAMYLANEEFLSGMHFFLDAVKAGFPIAHNPQFQWVTAFENYWYSRYVLFWGGVQSHMGVGLVHGPYWTVKARQLYQQNRLNRDRGERVPSNKDVLLGRYMPLYYQRTGFPRVFEDASMSYLDYTSGDPHLVGPVIVDDNFKDPQSGKNGDWGVARYWIDLANSRWNHDRMDTTLDMGAVAQGMLKKILWVEYMFHSDHVEESPSDRRAQITLLGNDAEEGFRGVMLTLAGLNGLLEAKASFFADETGARLGGIDPFTYDPQKGLRYLPHQIAPNLVMLGDLPERLWALDTIKDNSSQLWDQASWLWGASEYYYLAHHFKRVFTDNPPVDGGIVEKRTALVARGLANVLVKNLEAMHLKEGVLASEWRPGRGAGGEISMRDSAIAIQALKHYSDRLQLGDNPEPELRKLAVKLLKAQADFLLRVQGTDGSFHGSYRIAPLERRGDNTLSTPQWWGIRALVAAWHVTEDGRYLEAARRAFNYLNLKFWDEKSGLYRTRLGDDTVVLTPLDVGAALGAMRELMLATPVHLVKPQIERFTRWWVQAVDVSGLQMSEDFQSGEVSYGKKSADEDEDGIPFVKSSHGRYGVAPVPAAKVAVNIGGPQNAAFGRIGGDRHVPSGKVRYAYTPKADDEHRAILLRPEKRQEAAGASVVRPVALDAPKLVERDLMERFDGSVIPLPASAPIGRGSDLTGAEIYRLNCASCHGERGEGITGKPLGTIATTQREEIKKAPMLGRFEKGMPPWGKGVDELAGVLSEKEIDRVVDFIKNELFKDGKPVGGSTRPVDGDGKDGARARR